MIETIITYVIGPLVGGLVAWFGAKAKYKVEVTGGEIENKKSELEFYKALLDDNRERLQELIEKNKALEDRLESQQVEINALRNLLFSWQTKVCMELTCAFRKSYNKEEDDSVALGEDKDLQ